MLHKTDYEKAEEQMRRDVWYGRLIEVSKLGFIAWVVVQVLKHFSII